MITELIKFLQPPDLPVSSDPKEQSAYLVRVNRYHFVVSLAVLVMLIGSVWAMSPMGFALAGTVDVKITEALKPIRAKQEEVGSTIQRIDELQKRDSWRLSMSLSNNVAADIRLIQSRRCKEKDAAERERLWREIEKRQEEYKGYRSESYPLPTCNEL